MHVLFYSRNEKTYIRMFSIVNALCSKPIASNNEEHVSNDDISIYMNPKYLRGTWHILEAGSFDHFIYYEYE